MSKTKVGTSAFADAVIKNLGKQPTLLPVVHYGDQSAFILPKYVRKAPAKKELVGVDLFVHWTGTDPNELAKRFSEVATASAKLSMITNRGIKVWPEGFEETFCTDHWRCRFKSAGGNKITAENIIELMTQSLQNDLEIIKTENLYAFDGVQAFSLGQGQ